VTPAQREALALERELLERELSRRRLKHFWRRCTNEAIDGWHIDEICAAVERVEAAVQRKDGDSARLIVEAPPGSGKSQIISRCLPLWYLGRHPKHEVVVATYGQDLADDLGRWAKRMVEDPAVQAVFPGFELRADSRAANRMDTKQGGGIRYVGIGGALTGRRANLAVVDDPVKDAADADSEAMSSALWAWYTSVLRTRLYPGGGIIVMHTRWRVNDLIGKLLDAAAAGNGEKFRRLTFAALAKLDDPWGRKFDEPLHPERYPFAEMDALRKTLPPRDWLSLYQQEPMVDTGNLFKISDFNLYKPGSQPKELHWYVATDLAVSTSRKADYTCIWPFGIDSDGVMWMSPDVTIGRLTAHESIDRIFELAEKYSALGIIVEGGAIWKSLEPEFKLRMKKRGRFFSFMNPFPAKDKKTRSAPARSRMEAGMMRYPDTRMIHERVIPEFLMFTGKNDDHDDVVDTVAWAALMAEKMILPYAGQVAEEAEDDGLIVPGSWQDIARRTPNDAPRPRRHSPPRLTGGERKSGKVHCYA
jgi:predicted phage terminase large subunit-like protein